MEKQREAIAKTLDAMMAADAGETSWAMAIGIMTQHYLVPPERLARAIYNTINPKRNGQFERAVYAATDAMGPVSRMTLTRVLEDMVYADSAHKTYAKVLERIRPDEAEYKREYAAGIASLRQMQDREMTGTP